MPCLCTFRGSCVDFALSQRAKSGGIHVRCFKGGMLQGLYEELGSTFPAASCWCAILFSDLLPSAQSQIALITIQSTLCS